VHGVEHADAHLGREGDQHAERSQDQHVGGDGPVGQAQHLGQGRQLGHDGHGLLVAHDGEGDDGHAGPHGDLHEPAPAEAPQLVALAVVLARALGALGEDHDQLLLLAQQAVGVVGVGLDAAQPGPAQVDQRDALEHVVRQPVDRPLQVALDPVHDRGGIGRDGPGVIGHHERPALAGELVEALPLDPEPALVERLVQPGQDVP
jgi:hypothetical protein